MCYVFVKGKQGTGTGRLDMRRRIKGKEEVCVICMRWKHMRKKGDTRIRRSSEKNE